MDFPCNECHYFEKCTVMKWFFRKYCEQGLRKKSQSKLADFPDKSDVS
jgi:hypothetical protein